jgi:hypothetical protein
LSKKIKAWSVTDLVVMTLSTSRKKLERKCDIPSIPGFLPPLSYKNGSVNPSNNGISSLIPSLFYNLAVRYKQNEKQSHGSEGS